MQSVVSYFDLTVSTRRCSVINAFVTVIPKAVPLRVVYAISAVAVIPVFMAFLYGTISQMNCCQNYYVDVSNIF